MHMYIDCCSMVLTVNMVNFFAENGPVKTLYQRWQVLKVLRYTDIHRNSLRTNSKSAKTDRPNAKYC